MTASALLEEVVSLGVDLSAADGQLRIRARPGVVTPQIRDALTACKLGLIALLSPEPDAAPDVVADAHRDVPDLVTGDIWTAPGDHPWSDGEPATVTPAELRELIAFATKAPVDERKD